MNTLQLVQKELKHIAAEEEPVLGASCRDRYEVIKSFVRHLDERVDQEATRQIDAHNERERHLSDWAARIGPWADDRDFENQKVSTSCNVPCSNNHHIT